MGIDLEKYLQSKGVKVKQAGADNIHCACFFCGEDDSKRGRLYIATAPEDSVGLFLCHLCGERGGLRKILEHFGDRPDAVSEGDHARHQILNAAARFYAENLHPEVLKWLKAERGLTEETVVKHQLGWAPSEDPTALTRYLKGSGFRWEDMSTTGLVVERDGHYRDYLQAKVTIPYLVRGNAVMIRGKDMDGKYVTPPGQKTRLYNTDALLNDGDVICTEGEFDSLVLEQMGYNAVGCPGSTSWQETWNALFDKRRVFVMFDPDEAGRKGAEAVHKQLGARARIVSLPVEDDEQPKDVDPSYLVVAKNKEREFFDSLLTSAALAGSLLISVDEAFEEWNGLQGTEGLKLGFEDLDVAIAPGLLPSQVMITLSKTGQGKQEPVSNLIPTPNGYRRMGDIQPGDEVFGQNGQPTTVVSIHPQGVKPVYRLTFSDGTHIDAGGEHLWNVAERAGPRREWRWKTLTTLEILDHGLRVRDREWRWIVPITKAVDYPEQDLAIDAYTLGALIANGSLSCGTTILITPDEDVVERIRLAHTVTMQKTAPSLCDRYCLPGLIGIIRDLGLDVKSRDKFIPDNYLQASVSQRISLLQGLMDGDGTASKRKPNSVGYSTTSERLAGDVGELVSSLGGTVTARRIDRSPEGRPVEFELSIMLPADIEPFSSSRKTLQKVRGRYERTPRRAITGISYIRDEESKCITVAACDSLYLTGRNYIVTHNSISLLNIFHRVATLQPDVKILFMSLEQTRGDWFERARRIWNFYNLSCPADDVNKRTLDFWRPRFEMVDKNRVSEEQLLACIEEYELKHGQKPDLIAIDYLGYWAYAFRGKDHYEQLSNAVMSLKAVAKEKRVAIIAPHQVNRVAEFGTEFDIDSSRGSGVIEETGDFVITLWNPDSMRSTRPEDWRGEVHLKIGKSRHGGKGNVIKLQFAPLTLAMVPIPEVGQSPRELQLARDELTYMLRKDTWEEAIFRHKTGLKDGPISIR